MSASRLANVLLALGLATTLAPFAVRAQVREVVSKEVSVGRSEASLALEFGGGDRLEIGFENRSVLVNDESVGSFEPGDVLDATWRALLAQAVALDDGPLATALADWTVPGTLTGDAAATAREIDQALESALRGVDVPADAGESSISFGDPGSLVRLLLDRDGRLELLDDALAGLDENVRVYVAEDVTVAEDEVVEGNLIVIDGDARIEGEVEGDVVVVGGTLELLEGSSVSGSVRLADARLLRNLGTVGDGVIEVRNEEPVFEEVREDIRREVIEEVRGELREEMRNEGGPSLLTPFRSVAEGVGGVLENLVGILILGLVGAAVIAFAGDKVDVIAETARRAPGRSAAVGMAGAVLLIPAWILGFVALVVSIVGIPVAIAWLPLFPLAAFAAALVGYLAIARNAGEWLADSEWPWTHWIRKSNSLITMVGGLIGLMALFIAANVVSIAPFLGFLTGLLVVAGVVVTVAAVQIGFGAVIITRGGRRREYPRYTADEAWEAAMNVDVDGEETAAPSGKETGHA
jgi:hypothetical protein